jgi:hypothetical protein
VRLASRGLRDLDGGAEPIEDLEELRVVRAQARRVLWESIAWTALVVVVVLLLP